MACALLCGSAGGLHAQPVPENEVKAAFLLNFAIFIEWPASAFAVADSPIAICILGEDPFGHVIDDLVQGESVNGRKVLVRRIDQSPAAHTCQIVFTKESGKDIRATLESLGPGVLSVGEGDSFVHQGGIIGFLLESRHVRFDIDQRAAEPANLQNQFPAAGRGKDGAQVMRSFRDLPIKQKLVVTMMVTTAAALLLAAFGIVLTDSFLFRGYLRRDLSALARIIAGNTTASLAFDDPKSAAETLATLRTRPHVVEACVYRPDGALFAGYSRREGAACPPMSRESGLRFTGGDLLVSQAIVLSGQQIGVLMLQYDLSELAERVRLYGSTVFGVLLGSSLLAFLLSAKLRETITAPVAHLVRATTSVSETGDYSTRAEKISGDELGLLVDRFNEMLAGIQSRDDALKKERERFRFMAESMPQKSFTARPDGCTDYLNRQFMEFTGLPVEQMIGEGWAQFIHPDDVAENVALWRHSVETGEPFRYEHRFRGAGGNYRWHLTRAHAMRDGNGNINIWIGSSTEIHEQKEKEEALRQANDDLQQFAYSASHDLREPIRNVTVYSEIVAARYRDVIDDEGRMFLGFLVEGGHRLAMLVKDLLAYTSAGTGTADVPEVQADSNAVLKHSLASLSAAIRESGAEVTSDALPEVYMGEAHLQQILQNLISNALRYRDQRPPRIHISAVREPFEWRFSVRDNGIGIDPQYKDKIFGIFKRLHHDRDYGGTGIGLAICKRVVERYGGRIWVESEAGKGATFFFTVPCRGQARSAKVDR